MTVKELIAELTKYRSDAVVVIHEEEVVDRLLVDLRPIQSGKGPAKLVLNYKE